MEDISVLETIMWERVQTVLVEPNQEEREMIEKIREQKNEENLRKLIKRIGDSELEKLINNLIDAVLEEVSDKDAITMEKYYRQRIQRWC